MTVPQEVDGMATDGNSRRVTRMPRMGLSIYDALLNDIMTLKIVPGGRIAVDAIAREFGVSQTPIREALTRLETEGLVLKTHLVGYSAAGLLGQKQFEDIHDLRIALEPLAASRAADVDDSEARALILAKNNEILSPATKGRSYSHFARGDAEFHDAVLAAGGNELMRGTLARMRVHFHLFRLYFHHRVTKEAVEEHAVIVDRIEQRDGKGAERAMRRHLQRSRDRFRAFFED